MSTVATPAVTPDELLLMPDEGRGFELVDGELRETNVSSQPSRVGVELARVVGNHCAARHPAWLHGPDAMFRCLPDEPGTVRRADFALIDLPRMTVTQHRRRGPVEIVPDLVAEVVSPNDLAYEVTDKRNMWLAAGVRLVWVVDPDDQTVYAYYEDGSARVFRQADTLTGEPVLPGFAVPVADLFKLPGA